MIALRMDWLPSGRSCCRLSSGQKLNAVVIHQLCAHNSAFLVGISKTSFKARRVGMDGIHVVGLRYSATIILLAPWY